MNNNSHQQYMHLALELARRGKGRVEPNPMVGCVLVKNGKIVGQGWHQKYGGPHAEVEALRDAGPEAEGADAYVTLEPCAHFGKTPPCTDALIEAKVKHVYMAMEDPFPQTCGIGPGKLRDAGIAVEVGILEAEARELNAPYLKYVTRGQSYVIAKWAMSLDGRIATHTGDSRWISGEDSRRLVHQIRNEVDAIMVGIGTVLADDPQLTCRLPQGRNPRRIVVDRRARTPLDSVLVRTAGETQTIIATAENASAENRAKLQDAGCTVLTLPATDGRIDMQALLRKTAEQKITNILVEGGAGLFASLFEAKAVDEVKVFVAPMVIGGDGARCPIGGQGIEKIADALRLTSAASRRIGDDILIEAKLR